MWCRYLPPPHGGVSENWNTVGREQSSQTHSHRSKWLMETQGNVSHNFNRNIKHATSMYQSHSFFFKFPFNALESNDY
jgi:hypothetical protein